MAVANLQNNKYCREITCNIKLTFTAKTHYFVQLSQETTCFYLEIKKIFIFFQQE